MLVASKTLPQSLEIHCGIFFQTVKLFSWAGRKTLQRVGSSGRKWAATREACLESEVPVWGNCTDLRHSPVLFCCRSSEGGGGGGLYLEDVCYQLIQLRQNHIHTHTDFSISSTIDNICRLQRLSVIASFLSSVFTWGGSIYQFETNCSNSVVCCAFVREIYLLYA